MGGLKGYIQSKLPKRKFDDWIEEALWYLYLEEERQIIEKEKIKVKP
jgi:hypothetical protein